MNKKNIRPKEYIITETRDTKSIRIDGSKRAKETLELDMNVIIDFDGEGNIIQVEIIK